MSPKIVRVNFSIILAQFACFLCFLFSRSFLPKSCLLHPHRRATSVPQSCRGPSGSLVRVTSLGDKMKLQIFMQLLQLNASLHRINLNANMNIVCRAPCTAHRAPYTVYRIVSIAIRCISFACQICKWAAVQAVAPSSTSLASHGAAQSLEAGSVHSFLPLDWLKGSPIAAAPGCCWLPVLIKVSLTDFVMRRLSRRGVAAGGAVQCVPLLFL